MNKTTSTKENNDEKNPVHPPPAAPPGLRHQGDPAGKSAATDRPAGAETPHPAPAGALREDERGLRAIYAEAGRLGAQPAGVPYAVYYNDPAKTKPADYDWEVCAPVRTAVQPKAPVVFRSEPAGKAVSLVYTGPYGTAEHTGSYTRLLAFGKTLSGYRFSGRPAKSITRSRDTRAAKKM